jgi:hypothetical protein
MVNAGLEMGIEMKLAFIGASLAMLAGGTANAEIAYGHAPPPPYATQCPPGYQPGSQGCICTDIATFYPPPGPGYNVHLSAPGVHVVGYPVEVASGQVYVEGAPIYVDAPPIHVASPQIYLARPKVYVRPGTVSVEPPTVHVDGCEDGKCEAVGTSYAPNP